jgi:carbon-monoxide dehydrogenase small subunit
MMAKKLLDDDPNPTDEAIRFGLSGNICRCTGYTNIFDAIKSAAREMGAARS